MFGLKDSQCRANARALECDINLIKDNHRVLVDRYYALENKFSLLMQYMNVELVDNRNGPKFSIMKNTRRKKNERD